MVEKKLIISNIPSYVDQNHFLIPSNSSCKSPTVTFKSSAVTLTELNNSVRITSSWLFVESLSKSDSDFTVEQRIHTTTLLPISKWTTSRPCVFNLLLSSSSSPSVSWVSLSTSSFSYSGRSRFAWNSTRAGSQKKANHNEWYSLQLEVRQRNIA